MIEKQQQLSDSNQENTALALKPGMDTVTLKAAMVSARPPLFLDASKTLFQVKFDSYLASPDLFIMPQLKYLSSAVIRSVTLDSQSHRSPNDDAFFSREKVKKRSVELICAAYASLYSAIMNPKNAYANPYSIMPHTPEQIVKLLS